eukprot:TRINITY_DN4707_c0_g2_i1.p1 TRINITY_DN4707_c0_g2~~TRINITY_DN4707_c0_g2_i1.p1  ORF type:complete len:247 (+),score=89.40 TRINITY_DN4707_c0_g2_i1:56-796(+)
MADDYKSQFRDVTRSQSVDEQAMTFLRAFVGDFQGRFEEILQLAEEFKSFVSQTEGKIQELDEFDAHRFLEKRGETKTVKDMRLDLQSIDLDSSKKVSFIEYLLFKYKKSLKDLFTAKPNTAALAKLEKAIQQYKGVFEEKKKKEQRVKELEAIVAKGGKEAAKAKVELRGLQNQDPAHEAKNEMQALQAKLAAKRALANPEDEEKRLYEEEKKRIEAEKKQKEDEEKRKREESRKKLKEKSSLWQ